MLALPPARRITLCGAYHEARHERYEMTKHGTCDGFDGEFPACVEYHGRAVTGGAATDCPLHFGTVPGLQAIKGP